MTRKSSLEMAREYEAKLADYLAGAPTLPLRAGKVNATAVATACGFDRQILYKNKACRTMLAAAAHDQGVPFITAPHRDEEDGCEAEPMVPASKLREEQRRVGVLEKRLSEMTARNAALTARLRQHSLIEDHLIAAGRRSRPAGVASLFPEDDE